MPSRAKSTRGRAILYNPTAAEILALGDGPWPGMVTRVNANGTCDIVVDPPAAVAVGAVLADPLIVQANASAPGAGYVQAEATSTADLANANKVGINALVTRVNQLVNAEGRKASVPQGGGPFSFSFQTGHGLP